MEDRWYNSKKIPQRKKQALRSVCAGLAFFGVLWAFSTKNWVVCPIRTWFGIACPGCGMTSGFMAILRGDFITAFQCNVLSVPLFIGIALYCIFSVTDIVFKKDYIFRIETQLSKKYMFLIYIPILALVTVLNNM